MTTLSWLREQRAHGKSEDDIRRALSRKGWTTDQVEQFLRKSHIAHILFSPEQVVPFVLGLLGWIVATMYLVPGDAGVIVSLLAIIIVVGTFLSLHTHHFSMGHAWSKRLLFLLTATIAGLGCSVLAFIAILAAAQKISTVSLLCSIALTFGLGIALTEFLYNAYCAAAFDKKLRHPPRLFLIGLAVGLLSLIALLSAVFGSQEEMAEVASESYAHLIVSSASPAGRPLIQLEGQVNAIADPSRQGLARDLLGSIRARLREPLPPFSARQFLSDDPLQMCAAIDMAADISALKAIIQNQGDEVRPGAPAPSPYVKLALYQNVRACLEDAALRHNRLIAR